MSPHLCKKMQYKMLKKKFIMSKRFKVVLVGSWILAGSSKVRGSLD
jgi:hypothetical protein